jgi:hypothetical protein
MAVMIDPELAQRRRGLEGHDQAGEKGNETDHHQRLHARLFKGEPHVPPAHGVWRFQHAEEGDRHSPQKRDLFAEVIDQLVRRLPQPCQCGGLFSRLRPGFPPGFGQHLQQPRRVGVLSRNGGPSALQFPEQRHTGTVAIFDPGRIHGGPLPHGREGFGPDVGHGGCIKPSGQLQTRAAGFPVHLQLTRLFCHGR